MEKTQFVALVDDHVLLRTGLVSLVNSFPGYKVIIEADNGQEFINKLKPKSAPDIVLLDITMPVMNGYETAQWIRINLPETRVLVLSMMDNDTAIINMIKLGAKGYVLKDCKPAVFQQALNSIRDDGNYLNDLVSNRMLKFLNDESGELRLATGLSEKEQIFLKWVCTEKTYKEIASEMIVSPRTVEKWRDGLFEKLGVTTRIGLAMYAIRSGIVKA